MMATTPSGKISRKTKNNESDAPSFEQTLGRLEEIVHLLEEGKIGLDEALDVTRKASDCCEMPTSCWKRPSGGFPLLSGVDSEGNPILRPMEDAASFSPEREVAARSRRGHPRKDEQPAGSAASGS